jgi:Fur family ferric uptake transcriptional regulator
MTSYAELALEVLKNKGFRITKPRQLVIDLLDKNTKPLSPYEIKEVLEKEGSRIDTVSVYRILECLEENKLIHRVLTTGKVSKCALEPEEQCKMHQSEHCHHLLICQQCEAIEEVHCPGTSALVKEVEKQSNFRIQSHNMEFFGLCANCA